MLSQSAASPTATVAQVTLPSPSLRRVSVSNIVSTFEQNKISPPVAVPTRDSKRASFPPPPQAKEANAAIPANIDDQAEVALQQSSPGDWTIVNSPAQDGAFPAQSGVDDADASSGVVEQPCALPATPSAADYQTAMNPNHVLPVMMVSPLSIQSTVSEKMPLHNSEKAETVFEKSVPESAAATKTASPKPQALGVAATAQFDPAVRVQLPAVLPNPAVAVAVPVMAAVPPAGARYTFEDVERITTFAKEELQRRADAEVAALTTQLAIKTAQTETLSNENTVLKDTLQQ